MTIFIDSCLLSNSLFC